MVNSRNEKNGKFFSSSIVCGNTLSPYIDISKNVGYLGCEFNLNRYFVRCGADRLVQFIELALYYIDEMDSNFYA